MVIECIGLPGSGKTELMELVEKELKRREVDYVNVSANLRRRVTWKILKMIAGALIYLSADARWLRDRLLGILHKEKDAGSFGVYENDKSPVRSIALYAYWYRRMIRSPRLYLFDEGLVHSLIMLCADHRISEEAFRKMVLASEKGIRSARLVIASEITWEESLAVIEGGDSRIDAFDRQPGSEERSALLGEFRRLYEIYKKDFRVLEIRKEDENRRKLSRVFGRIRQILSDADTRTGR